MASQIILAGRRSCFLMECLTMSQKTIDGKIYYKMYVVEHIHDSGNFWSGSEHVDWNGTISGALMFSSRASAQSFAEREGGIVRIVYYERA